MSPDNSVDSAESIALLSQYEQLPNPTASDSTPVLGRQSGQLSPRLEVILSQCQTENEIDREMWDDFEVHRRFADTYLKQYLDYSELMHAQRSRHVHEINEFDDENIATGTLKRYWPKRGAN